MSLRRFIPGSFEHIKKNKANILSTYRAKPRLKGVIVSMTTYEPRLNIFEYAVLSILRGSILPEKIVIYVPSGFLSLVLANEQSFIKKELGHGLIKLIEMDIDMRCHSKYFYSFQEFGSTKDIILCDDDVVYYKDWLRDLSRASKVHTEFQVFAFKAVDVQYRENKILPYADWAHCNRVNLGLGKPLYAEGVGGVYYRKASMCKETFDSKTFLAIAPNADDVWLWFCTHFNGLKVKFVSTSYWRKLQYIIPSSQSNALWIENTIHQRNDVYVNNCFLYFRDQLGFDMMDKLKSKHE